VLGPKGCCSDIQQSSSETDWYTFSNRRLYLPASRHTSSTYDWVGMSETCLTFSLCFEYADSVF